jgi:hypothetical protein
MAIPGAIVEEDVPVYLLNRKVMQASAAAASEPAQSASSCSPGPDGAIGKTVEEVPYGEWLLLLLPLLRSVVRCIISALLAQRKACCTTCTCRSCLCADHKHSQCTTQYIASVQHCARRALQTCDTRTVTSGSIPMLCSAGIKMVQAIDPAMIGVSKAFKSKVLYCVIDTGLDITNFEFSGEPCN